jgi:hypothetical protein
MKIRTIIDPNKGMYQVAVEDSADAQPVIPSQLPTTILSGGTGTSADALSVPVPGFYFIHNQSTCSLAKASTVPGAEYVMSSYWGSSTYHCVLTASTYNESRKITFVAPVAPDGSSSFGSSKTQGERLLMAADGSVILRSDGYYWLILAASGSLEIQ